MDALRGLAAAALLAVLGLLCVFGAAVAALALLLVLYWDDRVVLLSVLAALFGAGGAIAIAVARVRARDNQRLARFEAMAGLIELALRGLRLLASR